MSEPAYRDVAGFPGYRVGDDGSVWSRRTPRGQLRDAWKRLTPVVDSQTGYARVNLRRDGKTVRRTVHRLVLEAFVGPCPAGMEACHDPDPTRTNNRRSNLRWDTPRGNQADRVRHGTSNRGTRQHMAKLTEPDIPEIFAVRREIPSATMEDIGILFGVAKSTIQGVLERRNWHWVDVNQRPA